MSSLVKAIIHVSGVVQGVGFRPFVYRLAVSLDLKGYVVNLGDAGVEVVVEGKRSSIEQFIEKLKLEKPAPARVDNISVEWLEYTGEFGAFQILPSDSRVRQCGSSIPPDIAICHDCINDIMGKDPRWSNYPFTCCAVCGPRFTMILDIPYDREHTSMAKFPLCKFCQRDYEDPANRRYHAEGICCRLCGPKNELLDRDGLKISCEDPIKEAAKLIKEGFIVAVKGIGGFHIACLATDDDVVLKLRERRRRPQQPFAVMSPSVDHVESFAYLNQIERDLLLSKERPIVVLRAKPNNPISPLVSPGLDSVGVMLPYSGIHLLLLMHINEPAIIMTSANYPGEPMVTSTEDALKKLSMIVDYYLTHNREIVNRCDDSVIRVSHGVPTFLRRSRGYAPLPIMIPKLRNKGKCIVAFGGDFNVTISLLKNDNCYVSQHIGDLDNPDSLNFLKQAYNFLKKALKIGKIDAIACDLNRTFPSTRYAEELSSELGIPLIRVQHHHAHAASLAAEGGLGLDEEAVYITMDGVGLGDDGTAWGGEVLLATCEGYERVGHIKPYPLPGGDICAYYPIRALAGLLSQVMSLKELESLLLEKFSKAFKYGPREVPVVIKQLSSGFNVIHSSSTGRILDSISAMLGVCTYRSYEGEPAMKLEALARMSNPSANIEIEIPIIDRGRTSIVDASHITSHLVSLMKNTPPSLIARIAQVAIAKGLAEIACSKAQEEGIKIIGISGGAAVNEIMLETIENVASKYNLKLLRHRALPPGDGGLSVGQVIVGYCRLKA
ncbi:MAG: carbamoyltransferase HypF [Candidatus Nezhaarchaeales archaeon]|nr:MAG: carbamoyltransferase HypF [Candidatus Nezhaarchaeota archaeon WYZ-LMO8]